ncbi:HK97 family phage portal protein [Ruminiclostridium sufflavum DSM 19573]|uniref:HK97 family phage portal protein n=1 Tax=Ruminiclostridium sufflavum DSM 19573 TaxID=1121337 RepID=A0A318XR56_9FIRM|nr:phage portal protein [Ruminiclostridium sufflavum]PYG88492.1 HK97 family phage portal protein [Ruminiclostridium sufflavum DSM 19573]
MKFIDWIKDFFGVDQSTVYINQQAQASQEVLLAIKDFAICSAINLIAGAISKCEFKTYLNGNEVKGDEYYIWNVEPNKNQNSTQFIQEFISKLLYYNECLILDINGQLIIADDFIQTEYAVFENTFSNVVRGTMKFDKTFKMSEVLYFKYSNNDVKRLLSELMNGYNNLLNMAIGKYKRSGGRKGTLHINSTALGDKNFQDNINNLMNNRFKSYFESENAVLPLLNGYTYNEQNGEGNKKSTSDMVDVAAIVKEQFDKTAQAFKIPPSLLGGDISDVDKITDNFLTFCIDPLADMVGEEGNRKRYGKSAFLKGSFIKVDTTCIKHIDIFSISESLDKLIACGGYSIDELREKAGDIPLNTDWSKKHWITKNYSDIQEAKGGEE